MEHRRLIFACLVTFCSVVGLSSTALADHNLSLQATSDGVTEQTQFLRGDSLYLNILLDDPTDVAGCAFTLNYPANVVTAPDTAGDGTPVTPGEIVSSFPFTYNSDVTHRENASEAGKIYFSGAAINTANGGGLYDSAGEVVLFTVKFAVKSDGPFGDFQFGLAQTELWNLDAGYGTDNNSNGEYDPGLDSKDTVPVLVGAVDNQDPNWNSLGAAFPVLLGGDTTPFTPMPLALEVSDGDSVDDDWEMQQFGDLDTADDTTDFDDDGYLDRYEQPSENNTDPKVENAPFGPHYDDGTDNRAPYQRVSTTPQAPRAEAGATFEMDVNYTATDDNQALSGLGLRIHYDSSKLTWNGFSSVLATSKTDESMFPIQDFQNLDGDSTTDKYLRVVWADPQENWPGEALPVTLYTISFTADGGLAEGETSVIRFTASSGAETHTFHAAPVTFKASPFDWDADANGTADALTDGLLIIRYLFGFTGDTLVDGAVATDCTRCTAAEIEAYLADNMTDLDVDGNGTADALTDGLLIIRYLFGFTGDTLIEGAVAIDCGRCTAAEIETSLEQYMP